MIQDWEIVLRLLLAAALGALVGFERERHNQPAGLRTHTILVVGSALAATLSINLAMQFRSLVPNGDPARLAAQVVSGIGFLGAGAILREGMTIKGLTTATSMWTMAIVGLAVGAGYYWVSLATTVLLIIVLTLLSIFERRFIRPVAVVAIVLKADDRRGLIEEVRKVLSVGDRHIDNLGIRRDLEDRHLTIDFTVESREVDLLEHLADELSAVKGVRSYKLG